MLCYAVRALLALPAAVPPTPTAAAAVPTDDLAKLQVHAWQWVAYSGPTEVIATISDTPDYSLTFNADGTLAVKADCNQAVGSYQAVDGKLTINPTNTLTTHVGGTHQGVPKRTPSCSTV